MEILSHCCGLSLDLSRLSAADHKLMTDVVELVVGSVMFFDLINMQITKTFNMCVKNPELIVSRETSGCIIYL